MKLKEPKLQYQFTPALAVTGRVDSWLKEPTRRYPMSCTVFVVEDTMDEHEDGLEGSWQFCSKALRYGAGVAIHLSKLRPKGSENGKGLTASGPCSFMEIYSKFNETLRRGGEFKNGAVCCHLDYDHADILEFISYDRDRIPWVKRCVNVDENVIHKPDVLKAIMDGASKGDIWIVKKQYDKEGERIYHNVCQEILIKSRDTCLLSHINLGGVASISEIPSAMVHGMEFLCLLFQRTGADKSGIYKRRDNQVGLGVLGLSNLLAIEGVSYKAFVAALRYRNLHPHSLPPAGITMAHSIAVALDVGYKEATKVAEKHGMARAFTIAPTASCAYRYKDREGYTASPEISPPISRDVDRDSSTLGVQSYEFNPKCEIAEEVGWDTFFELNCEWQVMMDKTKKAHAISMNWWSDMVKMDRSFMDRWLNSPLKSLYYSLQVQPDTQDKTDIYSALGDTSIVDEYLREILNADNAPNCDCAE